MSAQMSAAEERNDRYFYMAMVIAMTAVVAAGFAPTFYLKPILAPLRARPLTPLVWVHGLLFTGWMVLLVTQASLVARDRVAVHMRLGLFGAVLAVAMVVVGLLVAISAAQLGHAPPGAPPQVFMVVPFFAVVSFAILVGAALALRGKHPQAHKRLMLLATTAMLGAAVTRLPFPVRPTRLVTFAITDLFVLALVFHDWRRHRALHPATLWGGLGLVVSQLIQPMIMGSAAWLAFATWLTG